MIDNLFRWQLQLLADSRAYREKLRLIVADPPASPHEQGEPATVELLALVGAVLLVEMHQRPAAFRAAEWIVSTIVPRFMRWPITRGPLQIADGPWRLQDAIRLAYSMLEKSVAGARSEAEAITSAAAVWNGEAVRQPGAAYGYEEVLAAAYLIVRRALADGSDCVARRTERASLT